jgi:mono/diheme cytochrome c family protein
VGHSNLRRDVPIVVLVLLVVVAAAVAIFVYSGIYNIGADAPHSRLVYNALDELRDRSIVANARHVTVPADLNSAKRIEAGAGLYAEMCTGCHLAPGMEPTEISQGLYPPAPRLAEGSDLTPAQEFWIIKHGVKLTAMPAWGKTHSDELIWDMVAFVRRLPGMTPQQYKAAVARAPADHDEMMEEMHKH